MYIPTFYVLQEIVGIKQRLPTAPIMLVDRFYLATPSSFKQICIMHGTTIEAWQTTNYQSAEPNYPNNASQVPECEGATLMKYDNKTQYNIWFHWATCYIFAFQRKHKTAKHSNTVRLTRFLSTLSFLLSRRFSAVSIIYRHKGDDREVTWYWCFLVNFQLLIVTLLAMSSLGTAA